MKHTFTVARVFYFRGQLLGRLAVASLFALTAHCAFAATTIDFDNVVVPGGDGSQSVFPGNLYASSGVLFSTGNLNTDAIFLGGVITFAKLSDDMQITHSSLSAVSQPNMVLPNPPNNFPEPNLIFYDLLLTFTTPVISVNVTSDRFSPETADIIRLLALGATATPNEFTVLAFDQKFDDAVAPPANLLSTGIGGNPFSYSLIEVISENEGFDNLTFTTVPEPSAFWLSALGLLALATYRLRASICRQTPAE